MILKILMCRCYKEEFQAKGHKYKKKIIHFHCKYKDRHSYYVLFCNEHPYGADFGDSVAQDEKKCDCKSGLSHEVYGFPFSVRYLLNFKSFNICVEELPGTFAEKIFPLDHYFRNMNCDPFFFLSEKTKLIEVNLDNLNEGPIPAKTDCKYSF